MQFYTYRIMAIDTGEAAGHYDFLIFIFSHYFDFVQSMLLGNQKKNLPRK